MLCYVPQDSVLPVFIETPPEIEVRRRLEERGGLTSEQIQLRLEQDALWELQARKSFIPYRFVRNLRDGQDMAVEKIGEYLG